MQNLMDSRIEPYCESCFYCIPEKNRIEITSIEYVQSSGPVEYEKYCTLNNLNIIGSQ